MNFLNSEGLSRVQTHIQTALDMKADKLQVEKQFTDSVADWNQNDEFAVDYVKNRPFYEIGFTAFSWDGNPDTAIDSIVATEEEDIKIILYKVSETPIPIAENDYYMSMYNHNDEETATYEYHAYISDDELEYKSFGDGHGSSYIYSINVDSHEVNGIELSRGIWIVYYEAEGNIIYPSEFRAVEIKTIDSKFLPNNIASIEYVDNSIDNIPEPDLSSCSKATNLKNGAGEKSIQLNGTWANHAVGKQSISLGSGCMAYGENSFAISAYSVSSISVSGEANTTTYTSTQTIDEDLIGRIVGYNDNIAIVTGVNSENRTFTVDKTLSKTAISNKDIYIYRTVAQGKNSTAIGSGVQAKGESSFATGYETIARGKNSFASGEKTYSDGESSHAEGYFTHAIGDYSHAEGGRRSKTWAVHRTVKAEHIPNATEDLNIRGTTAYGFSSHAEGASTLAYGDGAHSEGVFTTASGFGAHSEGASTVAYGECSHAEGYEIIANGDYQHVQGKYNIPDTTSAFIIGNGEYQYQNNKYSNAHTLDWSGNAWFAGDVYVGSTSGTNKDEGSKKLVTVDEMNAAIAAAIQEAFANIPRAENTAF